VQAALEIAKTKHYTNGMAECLLLKCELELQAQCFPQVNSPSSERSFDALLQKLNAHTSQNRDSQIFQQQFELLHPNFLTRLSQAFP